MIQEERKVEWLRGALRDLQRVPLDVREEIAQSVDDLRVGEYPDNAKVLKGLGSGVHEIVVDEDGNTYRAAVTVRFPKAVYVLHVFQKKSKTGIKTPLQDIKTIKMRLRIAEDNYKANYP